MSETTWFRSSSRAIFSAAGFKEVVQTGMRLQLNQSMTVDAVMQIGAVNEKVAGVSSDSER